MLYHVIRRPPHNYTNPSKPSKNPIGTSIGPKFMPRYHYSRVAPTSSTSSESLFPRQHLGGQSAKPVMTAAPTTTSNNNSTNRNNIYSCGSFKSTFIPFVTNNRIMTANKHEPIQIPITRDDGTTINDNSVRTVPITFVNSTSTSSSNEPNSNSKTQYTSFLRPTSRYSQNNLYKTDEELSGPIVSTALPRLPSVSRRLSLTIPVVTNVNTATTVSADDGDTVQMNLPSPQPNRSIPIRFPQGVSPVSSLPLSSSRTSSAIFRPTSKLNLTNSHLQRQKTDLNDSSTLIEVVPPSPARRAEVMAREAIQGISRFQDQQQQGNNSIFDNTNNLLAMRSPALSRRYIINLKNNQSVALDSRLSSANNSSSKPPINPFSGRSIQRHSMYPFPVTNDIQMPSHPATLAAENSPSPLPPTSSTTNRGSFKNEFRMEIPITIINTNDQENSTQQNNDKDDDTVDDEQQTIIVTERHMSTSANPTLKSILKRSSSREAVARKNVSFMNG